jgi:LAS superfamily LD-carboxypeptidase LdcB
MTMVLAAALTAPQLAGSAPSGDPRAERERVRAERAEVAAQIDTTKASRAELDAALRVLQDNLSTQEAALARAEAAVAQAEQDIADAQSAITDLTIQVRVLEKVMRERAVNAYVSPPGDDILTVLETKDFTTAASRKFYIELRAQDDADVADRLDGANVDLDYQKRKATAAKKRAETKRAEQAERTQSVRDAKAKQQAVADRLQATIDSQVARSLELAKTDRALSAQIAEEQAANLARLAALKAARDREAAAVQVRNATAANVSPSGQESAPSGGGGGTPSGASSTPAPSDSGVALAYVQGKPVNAAVAAQVVAMINAAAADGVDLRIGNSYRPVSTQIQLRRQNCGSSYYAIYEMSAGSCRPPTAKPGQSQHQLGLAIDFQNCSSRGTACYRWLAGNASRFGYYNLPSEAWHWSTTGK